MVAQRALRGERGFAQEGFRFGDFAGAEEQNAEVGRRFGVPRIEFERASEGAPRQREWHDSPIVPKLAGFGRGDGVTQKLRGFVEAALGEELRKIAERFGGGCGFVAGHNEDLQLRGCTCRARVLARGLENSKHCVHGRDLLCHESWSGFAVAGGSETRPYGSRLFQRRSLKQRQGAGVALEGAGFSFVPPKGGGG